MHAAFDVLTHLPADNDDDDKFVDVSGGRGTREVAGGPAAG
jgi:hypothetical protein